MRKAKYLLRTQQFKELCQRPETSALTSTTVVPATKEDGPSASQQHYGKDSSTAVNGTTSRRGSGAGLVQRGTQEHRDQSLRALKFLQTELSCVVDQSNPTESNNFKALIRGLLVGAFSSSTGAATSSSSNQVRANTNGHVQKTSVLLAPSPITSPTMNITPSFNTFNSASSTGPPTTRPFLAPANGSGSERRAFDANGGYSEDGVDDPSMHPRVTRPLRRRKSARGTFDPEELDSNGERIQQAGIAGSQVGENNIEVDEPKLGNGTMAEEDVEMEGGVDDELSEALYRERSQLYERLLDFFADEVKQPKGDLTDLVKIG